MYPTRPPLWRRDESALLENTETVPDRASPPHCRPTGTTRLRILPGPSPASLDSRGTALKQTNRLGLISVLERDFDPGKSGVFREDISTKVCGPMGAVWGELAIDCYDHACVVGKEGYGKQPSRRAYQSAREHEYVSCVYFIWSMPAPTKAGLACLSGSSSAGDRAKGRVVLNCTRSFEKSKSRVQSKATRTFFSKRGSFSK